MKKAQAKAEDILEKLGHLSSYLASIEDETKKEDVFQYPLEIIHDTMFFDISVLYRVSNIIENRLILEVVKIYDPDGKRPDFKEGSKLRIFLDRPEKIYINEATAFKNKRVSHVNVPGIGCDIVGYIYLPESFGGAFLFGGDFLGKESSVEDYEVSAVEVMCNLLSTILLRTQFRRQAEYDHLTGLYNSYKIKQEVERVIRRHERKPETNACIAMGDIDYFKKVNDTYGHIQGDMVLKEVGQLLSRNMRMYFDIAGRYGGEEFLLLFEGTSLNKGLKIVERIRKEVEKKPFTRVDKSGNVLSKEVLNITLSFGVAELKGSTSFKEPSDWISQADEALYLSKKNGRNRSTPFQS